jgi:hypothetical protein
LEADSNPRDSSCAYGFLVRDLNYVESALVILTVWLARSGWLGYLRLRKSMVGLDDIGYGLVFFAIALVISLRKAGLRVSPLESPKVKWLEQGVRNLWEGRGRHRLRR